MTIDKEALGKNPDVEDSNGINTEEKRELKIAGIGGSSVKIMPRVRILALWSKELSWRTMELTKGRDTKNLTV